MKGLVVFMTKTTLTNSKALEMVIATLTDSGYNAEVIAKLVNIKASIDKKNSGDSKKALARKAENKAIADKVLDTISGCEPMTVTDIITTIGGGYTNQKMTSILSRDDRFKSKKIKGKSYYSVA
jgi:hypothetical protein